MRNFFSLIFISISWWAAAQPLERFAFTAQTENIKQIGLYQDGSVIFVSPDTLNAHSPIVRPGTNQVFYLASESNSVRTIYSTDVLSGEMKKWGSGNDLEGGLQFSPDGQFLYYVSNALGSPDIYRLNLVRGNTEIIAQSEWPEFDPKLSSDGSELVYVEWTDEGYLLHSWNTQNKSHRIILKDETLISNVQWSKNDYSLIYIRNSEQYWEIREYFPLRDSTYQIRWGIPRLNTPMFTPSGNQLYYCMEVKGKWDIYVYRKASDKHHWMINSKSDELKPVFHPSGDWFWYNESTKNGWRVMKKVVRGKAARALIGSKDFSAYDAVWFPTPDGP